MMTTLRLLSAAVALCIAQAFVPQLASLSAAAPAPIYKIGHVTWHATKYVGQVVALAGYLLAREKGYVLFSDEPKGRISAHDLPVSGSGLDGLQPHTKYVIVGKLVEGGLTASNHNPYHLELIVPPEEANVHG